MHIAWICQISFFLLKNFFFFYLLWVWGKKLFFTSSLSEVSGEKFFSKTLLFCSNRFLGFGQLESLFVAYLTFQQHASVSQGWIYSDNCTCCHTEIYRLEVADQTFYLTPSQYTDTGLTSPSADPIMPGSWQGSHWSANFLSHTYVLTWKILSQAGFELQTFRSQGGRLNHLANEAVS